MYDNSTPLPVHDESQFTVADLGRTYLVTEVPTLQPTGPGWWAGRTRDGRSAFTVRRTTSRTLTTFVFEREEGTPGTDHPQRFVYRGSDGSRAVVYDR